MTVAEIAEIKVQQLDNPPPIPTQFLSLSGKQATLVNSQNPTSTDITNGKITIKFKDPTWVYDLTFWITENSTAQTQKIAQHTQVLIKHSRGSSKTIELNAHEKFADYYLKDFIDEIHISFSSLGSLKNILSPAACKKIVLRGFSAQEFHDFNSKVSEFLNSSADFHKERDKIIEDLTAKEVLAAQKETQILDLNSTIETLKTEVELLSDKEKQIQLEIEKSQTKFDIINNKSTELEDKAASQHEINNNLMKEIEANRVRRDNLLSDNSIFMEEFSSYVKQGRESINSYLLIGAACFIILFVCLYRLIASSLTLVRDPEILKEISAFDLLLSRLPFAIVLGIIMVAAMKILFQLLNRTFEIHQERLLLTKLSIIAKDNALSSADGLDIPAELIYAQKSLLKMELLKEFLSGNYRNIPIKQAEIKKRLQDFTENFHIINKEKPAQGDPEPIDTTNPTKK
ncbi:hypothetical protein [Pseudomonas sp. MPB26]|uniref:hypothetical protein n=1 Tax=Pseudomonas sp. MPB26 TaxID=3388491 RepID=UPI0039850FD2